jgi:hypothetical protein
VAGAGDGRGGVHERRERSERGERRVWIVLVASKVVQPSQTSFMPGWNIMEGVVISHGSIHELHTKKINGVILKFDFEKVYDKVNDLFYNKHSE